MLKLKSKEKSTIYLLTGKNDPIFTQHGSELMNEVLLKAVSITIKKIFEQIQFLIIIIHLIKIHSKAKAEMVLNTE